MKHEYLIQCKRVIISGKKSNKFIKLTLADKLYLMRLSRKLKKEGNIDSMSFEEFTLLCKHHKKAAMLRVESAHSTSFIDLLTFNAYTLHTMLFKLIHEIELYKEENKYEDIEDIIHLLHCNNVILFNTFEKACELLKVKILIE
jgi:hypothetical protein